ncbi:MAG TPA: undecaprenyl-phosphate glucose phosphotransferase [Steroidobacteraceae bacterium]|nr:undecaprenyl-phosphate glucose phosphotransferase [Steroidobacteraceae bacterium]
MSSLRSSGRLGRVEPSGVAVVRHLLFPISTVIALVFAAGLFSQPITRPYIILAVLAFALSWRLLGGAEFRTLQPLSKTDFFVPRLLLGWANVFGLLLFVGFAAKASDSYSRVVIVAWAILTPICFTLARGFAYRILCQWNRTGRLARTHIIIGSNATAREFASRLEQDPSFGTFIGFFDDTKTAQSHGMPPSNLLGGIADITGYVRRNSIDVIHIARPVSDCEELDAVLDELRDTTASIYFLPDLPHGAPNQTRIVEMAGMPLLTYFETPCCGMQGAAKRTLDILISAVLLLLLAPILVVISVLIRIDSRGPVFFKQRRYGLNGEEIAVYKFRSMAVCEDGGTVTQAQRNDTRVTRIGAFLRRSSLDELPQLFCVLMGSMSLVGPRPHAVAHNEMYRRQIDGYMRRHKVRPGITGWAQVNGLRGETNTLDRMQMRVAYDLDYLQHWSPWIDIKILWRTAWLVFGDRNAY